MVAPTGDRHYRDPGAQPEGTPTVTRAATDPAPAASPSEPEPESGVFRVRTPAGVGVVQRRCGAAREAIQQTRPTGAEAPRSDDLAAADAVASRDDLDADPEGLGGEDLLARELGASMIEEIKHS